jgi:hypothetical protein
MVADKKIPLLTEVYQPKPVARAEFKTRQDDPTLGITPELIARLAGHVRPRLEAEITQSVLESVREVLKKDLLIEMQDEIKSAQLSLEANTRDFVDKTKADLKTELPAMYQASADLVLNSLSENITTLQTNELSKFEAMLADVRQSCVQAANSQIGSEVEAMKTDASARIMQDLNQELQAFQVQSLRSHQTQLDDEMTKTFQSINQNAKAELEQQLDAMQTEALTQMRATFIEAMPSIYTAAVGEEQEAIITQISERLDQEMQAFQAQCLSNHQAQLRESMATTVEALSQTAKQDLQQQMNLLHADILSQMGTTFNDAIPSIYAAAVDEVKAKFADEMTAQSMQLRENFLSTINADLPAVQEVLRDNIQQVLASALPTLENDMRKQLTAELQDLLLKVKFVLPR